MKSLWSLLIILTIFTTSTPVLACKILADDFKKISITEVENFISEHFPEAKIDSIRVLNSGRIRIKTKSPIPRLYRVVVSPNCKKTVNIVRN